MTRKEFEMYSICSTCGKDDFDTKGKIFFTSSNVKASVCKICDGIILHMKDTDKNSLLNPSEKDVRDPCSMFNMTRNLKGLKDGCSNMYIHFQFLNLLSHYGQNSAIRALYALDSKGFIENGMYILASHVSLGSLLNTREQSLILNSPHIEERPYIYHFLCQMFFKLKERSRLFCSVSNIEKLHTKEMVIYIHMYYTEGDYTLNTYPDDPFHSYLLRSFKEGIETRDVLTQIMLISDLEILPNLNSLIDIVKNKEV